MDSIGKFAIISGLILVGIGGLFLVLSKFGVTSLPGDMSWRRGNFRFYVPLGTSILISLLLTILLNLFFKK